ncbi:hypothetical protein EJ08DRAFT_649646 [Tothia fuscella]|uniref:CENP-V/GFA domain-containing protein n=1 Tax=Tothia fuscella TaxID=1048955 RepID=A0A9P4NRG6_9PEZI|nr:hypothetical protein EJ08DRAFT_649646 [Tothia fuscella]
MPLKGHCNCEAIKVTISDKALEESSPTFCHCTNCRRQAGATGSYVMTLKDDAFKIEGKPKGYLDKSTDSGTPMHRFFCGDCGSPIMSVTSLAEGYAFVKMGLFDKIPAPSKEVYTRNRQGWEPEIPNTAQVEGAR